MAAPKLQAVEVFWDNPPDDEQGATLRRRYRGYVLERYIKPLHWLSQGDAAHLLGVSRMTIYRWVRSGALKDRKRNGISEVRMRDVRNLARARGLLDTGEGMRFLTN